jgi:cytochrome c oxidase subunit 4
MMADHATPHGAAHDGHDANHHAGEPHIVPLTTYFLVFGALMLLLVITLGAAAVNLGPWNIWIALAIAFAKAILILVFFMHLKWSSPLVRLFAGSGLFWLLIMAVMTMQDYVTRGWWGTH